MKSRGARRPAEDQQRTSRGISPRVPVIMLHSIHVMGFKKLAMHGVPTLGGSPFYSACPSLFTGVNCTATPSLPTLIPLPQYQPSGQYKDSVQQGKVTEENRSSSPHLPIGPRGGLFGSRQPTTFR